MNLNLGVIYQNGKIINHRSLVKIIMNPILRRLFGIAISSIFVNNRFMRYKIIKQKPPGVSSWNYKLKEGMSVKKEMLNE